MLDFKEITPDMKQTVDSYFRNSGCMGCEYTFSNLFIWGKKFKTSIAEYNGFLFVRYQIGGDCYHLMPAGNGDLKEAISILIENSKTTCNKLFLSGITPNGIKKIEIVLPNTFSYNPVRNSFDYIYNTDDLINLPGGKYHQKRNHIAKFEKQFGTNCYEELTESNIEECMNTYNKWADEHSEIDLTDERRAVELALGNFKALGLKGGLIRVDEKVCAFTAGISINDEVFDIHIEKGLNDCPGAYQTINRDFARANCTGYKYINREEDMGIEGLLKSKLSYHPAFLLEKNIATLKCSE